MRIFNGTSKEFDGLSNDDRQKNSQEAFRATTDNETDLMYAWAKEHYPKSSSQEWAMSLYTKYIEAEEGFQKGGYFSVFIKGSNVEGIERGREVDASLSKPIVGGVELSGWTRSSTIHTHPHWGSSKFSDIRSVGTGGTFYEGDIPWSLDNGVDLYLASKSEFVSGVFQMQKFDPSIFLGEKNRVTKGRQPYRFYGYEREDAKEKAISRVFQN